MNDLVFADGLTYFVCEFVEELYVVVGRDVRPEAAEEAAGGGGQLHEWDGLETERGGEISFEEGFEDFVSEDDHAERCETQVRLVRLDRRRWGVLVRPFGSR